MKVLAVMPVRDEGDIIAWTVAHLVRQGVQVYALDNWSRDGSWDLLHHLPLIGFERFPADGPDSDYSCRRQHRRIDEICAASDADWCVFHDADEIRRSPRKGETLAQGFARVGAEGYNVVNHRLYLFQPTDNAYRGDPERHFRYYRTNHIDSANGHQKAWKNRGELIGLGVWETGGGHYIKAPWVKAHPEPWTLKHYPIRSQLHGEMKMRDRLGRWNAEEKARGWHVQYAGLKPTSDFLVDHARLKYWHD